MERSTRGNVWKKLRLAVNVGLVGLGAFGASACKKSDGSEAIDGGSQTLLNETFESGKWPASLKKAGSCASVRKDAGFESSFGVRLDETCWIETAIPVSGVGYESLSLKLDLKTTNYDSGETVVIQWSADGNSWKSVASYPSTDPWERKTVSLVSLVGKPSILLRIKTNANGDSGSESALIDNLQVAAVERAGCDHQAICAAKTCGGSGPSTPAACRAPGDTGNVEISCGFCETGKVCQSGQCQVDCSPAAVCGGATCGTVTDEVCGQVACGSCSGDKVCASGECVEPCSPKAVCPARGAECGAVTEGTCGEVQCGTCDSDTSCIDNKCGDCSGVTCQTLGATCGKVDNGCGTKLNCGTCGTDQACGAEHSCAPKCADCGPLTSSDIGGLETFVECSAQCSYGKTALYEECMVSCGPTAQRWDKNLDGVVDELDIELAILESNDAGSGSLICYENGAVVPKNACQGSVCVAGSTDPKCADADKDGLLQYQEKLLGTSDVIANPECDFAEKACPTFAEECRYELDANRRLCRARDCSPGKCTAFHLEKVAEDSDEVLFRVYYDHSPRPATVLDLNFTFPSDDFLLGDARPLASVVTTGKELTVKQSDPGRLRLVVVGSGSTAPIKPGPIAELSFARLASAKSSEIKFSTSDYDQQWSIAPDQGTATAELKNDALWGTDTDPSWARKIGVSGWGKNGDRLLLHYSFDSSSKPRVIDRALTPSELCILEPDCPDPNSFDPLLPENAVLAATQQRLLARYEALQSGVTQSALSINGSSGPGLFLDGVSDHVELPLTLSELPSALLSVNGSKVVDPTKQSFTASLWFYSEGDSTSSELQVLWSTQSPGTEATQYAVVLVPEIDGKYSLAWLEGDVFAPSPTLRTFATGLAPLVWRNLAVALNAGDKTVSFYLDGALQMVSLVAGQAPAAPVADLACPQVLATPDGGIQVHEEGENPEGLLAAPSSIYFTSAKDGLYGVERMDPTGLGRQEVLRNPNSSAQDVHYSPLLNKLIYSSSESGSTEIWVANGDGSNARQVTFGFGDTARGVFARRPKWSSDGSMVVFESNVYDVEARDNYKNRVYRLFRLAFDPQKREFAIPSGDQTLTSLTYGDVLSHIADYALTGDVRNASGPSFLPKVGGSSHEISYTASEPNWSSPEIRKLTVSGNSVSGVSVAPGETLLAEGSFSVAGKKGRVRLSERGVTELVPATNVRFESSIDAATGKREIEVIYEPLAHPANCWDQNRDGACQSIGTLSEDLDGSGTCDVADCNDAALPTIELEYKDAVPVKVSSKITDVTVHPWLAENGKTLKLSEGTGTVSGVSRNYVRLEISSPKNILPIPSGTTLATIRFTETVPGTYALTERFHEQELSLVRELEGAPAESGTLLLPDIDEVVSAAFSPDGKSLVFAGIEKARPVLAVVDLYRIDLATVTVPRIVESALKLRKVSVAPTAVESLQWIQVERSFPCQWMGAQRDQSSKMYLRGFRGGFDEFKLYSYVRTEEALASEAERGHERLAVELASRGQSGPPSQAQACTSSLDCNPFERCVNSKCIVDTCSATDPCVEGKCVSVPSVVVPGGNTETKACSVECSADSQCFEQQCLNGPCRFCEQAACNECRVTVRNIGTGINVREIEGCPDQNSFNCVNGSCVSECYVQKNGQSVYQCNESTEYCYQGRCRLLDWYWNDLAPSTFAGLSPMRQNIGGLATPTVAVSQLNEIEIKAYGVEDYGRAPRILVEGKVDHPPVQGNPWSGTQLYGGDWFNVGQIIVDHKNVTEASVPYKLATPFPLTAIRIRLVHEPFDNPTLGATGRGDRPSLDDDYCKDVPGPIADADRCRYRPVSSRNMMGYNGSVAEYEAACAVPGGDCSAQSRYLRSGRPAVILQSVRIRGNDLAATSHAMCSYEGNWDPIEPATQRLRELWFGDIASERSNLKAKQFAAASFPSKLLSRVPGVSEAGAPAGMPLLLNCGYADGSVSAGIVYGNVAVAYPHPLGPTTPLNQGNVFETAGNCWVENGSPIKGLCYEWASDAYLDPLISGPQLYKTLEFQNFTSFGYDGSVATIQ